MKLNKVLIYVGILAVIAAYVYVVEIRHKQKTQAAAEESQRIVDIDRDKITHLVLKSGKKTAIELKKPTNKWIMTLPVKTNADQTAVKDLLYTATTGKREKIIQEKDVNWKEFGLDKPDFRITLNSKDKSTTISFGATNPSKSSYYVRVDDDSRLLLVADTFKNSLNKTAFDLRDKQVLAVAPEDVDHLVYDIKGEKIELKREGSSTWYIIRPERLRAKAETINRDLITITNLAARNIIDKPEKEGDPYGLQKPETRIRLAGQKLERTLLVGKTVSESGQGKGSASNRYAQIKGFDTVYEIDTSRLKKIKTSMKDLQDRSLLSFDVGDIQKMTITFKGKEYLATKGPDNKWKLEKPVTKEDLETWYITSILWDIKDLEWKSVKKEGARDPAAYHLDKPQLVVSFVKKGEKEPLVLKAGWKEATSVSPGEEKTPETSDDAKPSRDIAKQKLEAQPTTPQPGEEETAAYPYKLKPDLRIVEPEEVAPAEPAKPEEPSAPAKDDKAEGVSSDEPKSPAEIFALAEPHDYKGGLFILAGDALRRLQQDLNRLDAPEKKEKE